MHKPLKTGPRYPSLKSHLGCINMPVLHPGGACMALVPHRDTNQEDGGLLCHANTPRFLSYSNVCPLFLLSLTLSTLASPLLLPPPPLQHPLDSSLSLFFSSPSKSSLREEGASRPEAAEAGLSLGGQPAPQCTGLFPGPTKSTSYSNVTIRPPDRQGGSLWLQLRVVGSRW